MFTGIVEEVGSVAGVQRGAASARIIVQAERVLEGTEIGDSVSISGVCLTVIAIENGRVSFDAVPETLVRSTLKDLRVGDKVNLERSLAAGQRMGGHFVQGHVDGVATLRLIQEEDNAKVLCIAPPRDLMRYIAPKGSVALDGISLTVAEVGSDSFTVWIIPHTYSNTTLRNKREGDPINIETDMLARYLDQLLAARGGSVTEEKLRSAGFE